MQKRSILIIITVSLVTVISALFFMTVFSGVELIGLPVTMYKWAEGSELTASEKIVLYMRMPAILMALIAGIGLSVSGGVMQSITHNDLVSPFTLGISAAAAFGASVCIISGNSYLHSNIGIIIGAFIASCLCVSLVYGLSAKTGTGASVLVLTGIAMNYLFSALSATIQFFAQEYKLGEIIQWTFGTFNKATWANVGITAVVVVFALLVYFMISLPLDAMANNNDEIVMSLGVNPQRIRIIAGLTAVFITATVISFTGVIGFVGLIAPHIARLIVGNEHRLFLPMAGITGACLLLYSDTIGKYILYPVALPVGIVISFVGVPVFIHLVLAARKRGA